MSARGTFNAAFVAAVAEQSGERRLALVWDHVSRALPRRVDLGALVYSSGAERRDHPLCSSMEALMEHYAKPLALDMGRERVRKGSV